ncbi:MAG: ATP-binding protein [Bryobacteraceae bacterium]|nr:ATP-binding protein [Bryobacteraceae bacterium]MDW8377068.1 ATP-binding protein [Bryobacterales bacterium]
MVGGNVLEKFNGERLTLFRSLGRRFGDLKVRPKLIVLHNTFFLILTCAVYFSLIPLVEERALDSRRRENQLLDQIFRDDRPLPQIEGSAVYEFREGDPATLQIPPDIVAWLDQNPGEVYQSPTGTWYRKVPSTGEYRTMQSPDHIYAETVQRAQRTLFVVLGAIYCLAVFALEFLIMPLYVYRPIRLMLHADRATQQGDRAHELIREADILNDEIGQIMRSRNATVAELRRHEDSLAEALEKLERYAEDLRRKNEMLETAKKNLENQDRLASIGLLSASVAHEINTPLTVLHGSIEKLLETAPDPATKERLNRMLRVTQRLRKIGESLVDFARARRQVVEPVAVRALVEEAWNLLAIDDKAASVNFRNESHGEHWVEGDSDKLLQVFVNLLRNALHAVSPKGHIRVSSAELQENGKHWIRITVDDDGPGIPPEVLPGIFDAFVTTRLDSKGTGLGLTVSEGIVRQHGGSIAASNREGGGARLEVLLPAALKPATIADTGVSRA